MSQIENHKNVKVAYSPDTDDAFMMIPLMEKNIDWRGWNFEFVSADIQELNEAAASSVYDITAISVAAYPSMSQKYYMAPVGASIGDQFGPVVVVKADSQIDSIRALSRKKIAVPGEKTSAYFAARAVLPEFEPVFMLFSDIEQAVLSGEVDAGVLIHELQIEIEGSELRKIGDLGALWSEKFDKLPLPLGTNAISKRFNREELSVLLDILRESIRYSFSHRDEVLAKAIDSANPGMKMEKGQKYIDMYVNEHALTFTDSVKAGIQTLYDEGFKAGLCPKMSSSEYLVE